MPSWLSPQWLYGNLCVVVITGRAHCFHDYIYKYKNNHGIFLTSLNLTCTKVKTYPNPVMTQHTEAVSGNPSHSKCKMGQRPCAKTQDCTIFSTLIQMKYQSLFGTTFGKNRITQEPVHQFASQINLLVLA